MGGMAWARRQNHLRANILTRHIPLSSSATFMVNLAVPFSKRRAFYSYFSFENACLAELTKWAEEKMFDFVCDCYYGKKFSNRCKMFNYYQVGTIFSMIKMGEQDHFLVLHVLFTFFSFLWKSL